MPTVQTFYGDVPGSGPTGENVTWDMATLQASSVMDLTYTASGTAPFLDATVQESYVEEVFIWNNSHYQLTNDALLLWGAEGNGLTGSDPMKVLEFPCTYGTTWTDDFAFEASGFYTLEGTITGEADGYGTLIMPYGPVEDVLRVTLTMNYIYEEIGIGAVTLSGTDHVYYRPGVRVPILAHRDQQSAISTLDMIGSRWVGGEVALGETDPGIRDATGMVVCPNPASYETFVRFDATAPTTLEVIDAMGRIIQHERLAATGPAMYNERLDLYGLAKGPYVVRLTDAKGHRREQKLIVR